MSEPSQTAKERAERVWDNYSGYEGKGNFIPAVTWEITAAEQAAFQRGKEEGRQSGIRQAIISAQKTHAWNTGEFVEMKHEGAKRMREQIVADLQKLLIGQTNPTAQPAEPSKKKYIPWSEAGGPNECKHGYAAGIPCPDCDAESAQPAATILDDYERGRKAGKEEGRREERERIFRPPIVVEWPPITPDEETGSPDQPAATLETRLMDLEARVQRLEGKP